MLLFIAAQLAAAIAVFPWYIRRSSLLSENQCSSPPFSAKSLHSGSFAGDAKNSNAKKAIKLGSAELQRAKFFNVPVSATREPAAGSPDAADAAAANIKANEREASAAEGIERRTIGCQTIHREQSAQTLPFRPDAVLRQDAELPEVVLAGDVIDDLSTIGRREIGAILEMRARRQWENVLLDDAPRGWSERRALLEAIEWENWLGEESHFESNQLERLKIVEELIENRENSLHHYAKLKYEQSIDRLTARHQREIDKIQ